LDDATFIFDNNVVFKDSDFEGYYINSKTENTRWIAFQESSFVFYYEFYSYKRNSAIYCIKIFCITNIALL